ncbi:MAG: stage II sporulation protein E, partial [Alicyclobacillus sp.]|nr:stage II sporulation protein E [Alicyclobacillus sp.]
MSTLVSAAKVQGASRDPVQPVSKRSARVVIRGWLQVMAWALAGVLLGRATIEHAVSPFAIAYFAVVVEWLGVRRSWPALAAAAGAYSMGGWPAAVVFVLSCILYVLMRRLLFRRKAPDPHWVPFLAGAVDTVVRLAAIGTVWTRYDLLLAFADGGLAVILSLIFLQCAPVLVQRSSNRMLRAEQWISLAIFFASGVSGLTGLAWHGVALSQAVIDWGVLLFALAGGASAGAAAAVVMGTLALLNHSASLSAVAVLAFAGLLAGLLRDAGRLPAALAFVGSTALLSFGASSSIDAVEGTVFAALAGSAASLLTPRRWRRELAAYVPGTVEHRESEQQRARRIRKLLTERIEDVSQVFEELSAAFAEVGDNPVVAAQQLVDHAVGRAAKQVCQACPRQARCWDKEGLATYQAIVRTVERLEAGDGRALSPPPELRERCIRVEPMLAQLRHNLELTDRDAAWLAKLREQRSLLSAQLAGVAEVVR